MTQSAPCPATPTTGASPIAGSGRTERRRPDTPVRAPNRRYVRPLQAPLRAANATPACVDLGAAAGQGL